MQSMRPPERNGEKGAVEVRRATKADLPAIMRFVQDCYGASAPFKGPARWRWQFLQTPYGDAADPEPPVWIAVVGGEVVGQIALQQARMFVGGQRAPAGWIVDVMVRPEFRGRGLSHQIHDALVASGKTLVTLTMAPATRRIAERAGALTLPPVYEMIRPRRLSGRTLVRALRERVERRSGSLRLTGRLFVGSVVGPALAAGSINTLAPFAGLRGRCDANITITHPAKPPLKEAEALFLSCAQTYEALFDRGADFLDWRFGRVPDLDYRWSVARRDGVLCGLAVWRLPHEAELPVGVLTDVIARPDDPGAQDELVASALALMHEGTEAVLAGASHPAQVESLKRHGFFVIRTHRPTIVTLDEGLLRQLRERPSTWRLSKGDHDWDQVLPASF
jgi:GNAT superfamily N-acetyltransferase